MSKNKTPKRQPGSEWLWEEEASDKAISARKKRREQSSIITAFIIKIVVIALALWAVFALVFGVAVNSGESMYPRLRDGDLLIFYRLEKEYNIGDVLVLKRDGVRHVGRVVATGNDTVELSDSNELMVNGNIQSEEIFYPTEKIDDSIAYPYTVPADSVFLLCDLRPGAVDSRTFGAIADDDIDGKIITFLRRRGI